MTNSSSFQVNAILVGVASPAAFAFRGKEYAFKSLRGITGDMNWYENFLRTKVPKGQLSLTRLTSPSKTKVKHLKETLTHAARTTRPGELFVLVLCEHGFQAADDNGDESDGLDEVFAASDGPVADDFFASLWAQVPADADVVVFADTCSADSVGIAGGRSIEPVVSISAVGPSRLSISASMPWEKSFEHPTRHGPRGVMSLSLEDAWNDPEARASYLTWFYAAAELVSVRRPQQHPRLRYLGPDQSLLTRAPLTLRSIL